MLPVDIADAVARDAVSALAAGDLETLERLLAAHPRLAHERFDCGEGYVRQPYLLWFVAENPIRHGVLPRNIVDIARAIVAAAQRQRVESLSAQLDYALALVCSGRVPRECGVQLELIDMLVEAGARPDAALVPALAHREAAAVERLLQQGATMTVLAAVCTGRQEDSARLMQAARAEDRQLALAGAALHGRADAIAQLIGCGVDVNTYSPPSFHPHGTALHHAVDSGSLEAVTVLVEAGADLGIRDRIHRGTPLDWADYLGRAPIATYLRAHPGSTVSEDA